MGAEFLCAVVSGKNVLKMPSLSKKIAFFDVDGTITRQDSFLDFIQYYKGKKKFYIGWLLLSPWLVLYKLKLISNWKAKERVLTYFFKGESLEVFQQKGDTYALQRFPQIIRSTALRAMQQHLQDQTEVYCVSASAENWLQAWCHKNGMGLIGTRLEVLDGRLTGKIAGLNCYGPEKVVRIREELSVEEYDEVYVYGDSPGDREMLALAHHPHYRFFS